MAPSNMTASAVPDTVKAAPQRRAAQSNAKTQNAGRSPVMWILFVIAALAFGIGIGTFVTRQRYKAKEVVASVNGTVITKEEFYDHLESSGGVAILRQMMDDELQLQFARDKGVYPKDEEVEAVYARMSKETDALKNAAVIGRSVDAIKQDIRVRLARTAVVAQGVKVTDADIHDYYTRNVSPKNLNAQFYQPEKVTLAAIITKTEAEGQSALTEMNKGIAFATAAKKYSVHPSKEHGGVLPTLARSRTEKDRVPELEDLVFQMKIGQRIGPQKVGKAWWIVRCLDKKPSVVKEFEKVKDDCRRGVELEKGLSTNVKKVSSDYEVFTKKASLKAFWTRYQGVVAPK